MDSHVNDRTPVMAGRHFPELDGIRGIAIGLVLVFHCSSIATPETPLASLYIRLASMGWVGVDLFFVLSGFLITAILLDTVDSAGYFRNFYTRRILRIFPIYYASIATWSFALWWAPVNLFGVVSPIANISYWFYLQNWLPLFGLAQATVIVHFWSLAVEEQYYLLWPLLIRFATKLGRVKTLCTIAVLLAVLLRLGLVLLDWNESAFYFTFSRIDGLAIGAYVAVLLRRHGTLAPCRRPATLLIFMAGATVLSIIVQQRGFYNLNPVVQIFGVLPLGLFFGCFLIISLTAPVCGMLRLLLRNRGLCSLGEISYGVYVFHWPIMLFLKEIWPGTAENFWWNQSLFLGCVTVCTVAVAYISFRYFESPILSLKHQWAPLKRSL